MHHKLWVFFVIISDISKEMRRKFFFITFLSLLIIASSCQVSYYKVPITKSKKRFRPYDSKKDRGKKRIKTVKYKSLNSTSKDDQ